MTGPIRRHLIALGPLITLAIVITWVVLAVRTLPQPSGDYGVFVAVADRLRAGDRLYVDVWDNKDPLTYLALAVGRAITPLGGWLLELLWLAVISAGVASIARSVGSSVAGAALAGFVMAPVIATGAAYWPGTSHQLGIAIGAAAIAAAMRGRGVTTGVLVALLALAKITVLPVALAVIIVIAVRMRSTRFAGRAVIGAAAALTLGLLVLAIRGELAGYVQSIADNLAYNATAVPGSGRWSVLSATGTLVITASTLVVLALTRRLRGGASTATAWWACVTALAAGLAVIVATGKFWHHAQVLVLAALMAAALLVVAYPSLSRGRLGPLLLAVISALLLAGAPLPRTYLDPLLFTRGTLSSWQTDADPAIGRLPAEASVAVIGQGNDTAQASLLLDHPLACPRLVQYPWESAARLADARACAERAGILLISPDVRRTGAPAYDAFVADIERLVATRECIALDRARLCLPPTGA